jgi:hypothetical protein
MKRVISLTLSLCLIMSMCVFVNAATFSDLADNHWAYKNIMSLVNEGTINGMRMAHSSLQKQLHVPNLQK